MVALNGTVDFAARLSLAPHLDTLTAVPRPDLVLDLRSMSFIDCAGLGLLCRVRNRVLARDGRLRLVADSPSFRRILTRAGLGGVFQIIAEPDEGPTTGTRSGQDAVISATPG
ncbi:STAS domain-containing protein [Streptomyces sp. NPDC056160]|uniref:STAS domain-containing protein n=1 Tax=Streptomyces sp. NPDC056160 TaxID=3345731 RepID=UPI0035DB20CB